MSISLANFCIRLMKLYTKKIDIMHDSLEEKAPLNFCISFPFFLKKDWHNAWFLRRKSTSKLLHFLPLFPNLQIHAFLQKGIYFLFYYVTIWTLKKFSIIQILFALVGSASVHECNYCALYNVVHTYINFYTIILDSAENSSFLVVHCYMGWAGHYS
jgi:hypothetical protein